MSVEWKNFSIVKSACIREEWDLLDFQQYTVFNALQKKSFLIGLPTGGGKTFTSLSTFFYYKERFPKAKLIIVTNKSALFQFDSEISKFFNYEKSRVVIHSRMATCYKKGRSSAYQKFLDSSDTEVLIMNYPILQIDNDEIVKIVGEFKKQSPENKIFVIYDEATAFKNIKFLKRGASRKSTHTSVSRLTKLADRVIALTATFTKGKLEDAYGIFSGIGIQLTTTRNQFLDKFCTCRKIPRFGNSVQVVGYKNLNDFNELVKPHCVILNKSDIFESLPSFTSTTRLLEYDSTQKEHFKLVNTGKFTKVEDDGLLEGRSTLSKIASLGFTRMTCLDPNTLYPDDLKTIPNYISPKTQEIVDMLNEEYSNEKIVLYTSSRRYIKILEEAIAENVENESYKNVMRITGDVSSEMREDVKRKFTETSDHNLLIINKAGIESLNLQISNIIIVCDVPDSAGNLVQLLGRISRIGSKHTNLNAVYLLMKDTQDEDEYFIINKQLMLLHKVLGESERGIIDYEVLKNDKNFAHLTEEELTSASIDNLLLSSRKTRSY